MTRKRILFISNLYPNQYTPNAFAFSRQQVTALSNLADVDVIAPIPWPIRLRVTIPYVCSNDGMEVYHPTFYYTPKVLRPLFGYFFLISIRGVARMLIRKKYYDYIYASWLFPDGWAAAQLARCFNKPLFINVVGTDVNRLRLGSSITAKSLVVVDKAQRVIAVSAKLKEHLVALGAAPQKIAIVYNGVNRSIFYPMPREPVRRELGIPEGRSLILFVGNLIKEKGVLELVKAFSLLVKSRTDLDPGLVVIGCGPYARNMQNMLKAEGVLDRVSFLGSRTQEDVAKWMNACDLFCLPSYMEGQPNVVIEALACNSRIVATNVGGIPELDKGRGVLRMIDPKSVSQLAQALDWMLSSKTPVAESEFIKSWQENAAQILDIFNQG